MTWEDLLEEVDIVEYIEQYVELEYRGAELWGLSPFKEENTPSFSVDPVKQQFYCYSSGLGGNIYSFIMEYHKVTFPKSVDILREYLGCDGDATIIQRPPIVKLLKKLQPKNKREKDTSDRKILASNYMDRFEKRDITWWQKEGLQQEIMDKIGVRYCPIQRRIITPIWDNEGRLINTSNRATFDYKMELAPKFIYSFPIGTTDFLWGLHINKDKILEKKEVILVESYKSVMKLMGWGIENAVAVLTSHLNSHQLKILIGLGVNVVVAFDKDARPRQDEEILKLKRFCKVEFIEDKQGLLGEKDAPCDNTFNIWQELYEKRKK